MKKLLAVLGCVILLGVGGCFSEQKNSEENEKKAEEQILENGAKTVKAREELVSEALRVFENENNIGEFITKKMKRSLSDEKSMEDKLNLYFDALDKMELKEEARKIIDEKVEKLEKKYIERVPKPIEKIFEEGRVPEGITETKEALIIGGDIVIEKANPQNAMKISNLIRKSKNMPLIDNSEAVKRGFYSDNTFWCWDNDLWGNGDVKYRFTTNIRKADKVVIKRCMQYWADASGGKLKFKEYEDSSWNRFRWKTGLSNHVQITRKSDPLAGSSWSTMGEMVGARIEYIDWLFDTYKDGSYAQSMADIESTVTHELGHTLGLFHEHQRPDRDKYIKVNYDAVKKIWPSTSDLDLTTNWRKVNEENYTILFDAKQKMTSEYDYHSIMHYPTQGNKISGYTILKLNGEKITDDDVSKITDLDAKFIKELY